MSIALMSQLWGRKVDGTELLVLLALADHAHDDGTEIRPSVGRLAWKLGVSDRTVQRTLRALEAKGVLTIAREADWKRMMPRVYRMDVQKLPERLPYPGDNMSPPPGDSRVTPPVTAVSPEPSLEPSRETKNHGSEEGRQDVHETVASLATGLRSTPVSVIAPAEIQLGLLEKLNLRDRVSIACVVRLNKRFTRPVVTVALQHLSETGASPTHNPMAMLTYECKRVAANA